MLTGTLRTSELPLEAIAEPPLGTLYGYWRDAVKGRSCLPASEMRPELFARALPYIAIVERAEMPRPGLRIRLCGSDIENRDFGLVRGAYLEDVRPEWYRAHLVPAIAGAIDAGRPRYQRIDAEIDGKSYAFTRLLLPLASGGEACDSLIVATVRQSDRIVSEMRARLSLA
ncbi:MAG: hypothetical protein KIT16_17435 [Rhodospirillaceae bacterium]|nr:hypothetical protein [Rhodospirillaceae bacterium]